MRKGLLGKFEKSTEERQYNEQEEVKKFKGANKRDGKGQKEKQKQTRK